MSDILAPGSPDSQATQVGLEESDDEEPEPANDASTEEAEDDTSGSTTEEEAEEESEDEWASSTSDTTNYTDGTTWASSPTSPKNFLCRGRWEMTLGWMPTQSPADTAEDGTQFWVGCRCLRCRRYQQPPTPPPSPPTEESAPSPPPTDEQEDDPQSSPPPDLPFPATPAGPPRVLSPCHFTQSFDNESPQIVVPTGEIASGRHGQRGTRVVAYTTSPVRQPRGV